MISLIQLISTFLHSAGQKALNCSKFSYLRQFYAFSLCSLHWLSFKPEQTEMVCMVTNTWVKAVHSQRKDLV